MAYVSIDKSWKIYLPKFVRERIDKKAKYLVLILPDGDVILHMVKKSKDPLKDFQKTWKITKSISTVREEILKEAMKSAGE